MSCYDRFKAGCRERRFPTNWGILFCYLLTFLSSISQFGFQLSLQSIHLNTSAFSIQQAIPISMFLLSIPYLCCTLPAYFIGQKFRFRKLVIVGFFASYLGSLSHTIVCMFWKCNYLWVSNGVTLYLPGYILFCVGNGIKTYGILLLMLDQIPMESSRVRSVVVHWYLIFYYSGALTASTVFPLMMMYLPSSYMWALHQFVLLLGLLVLLFSPFQNYFLTTLKYPFKLIFLVTRLALKGCKCRTRRNMISDTTSAYANRMAYYRNRSKSTSVSRIVEYPNCFERIMKDYGGPLQSDDVRDVQRFYVILLMLSSFAAYFWIFSMTETGFLSQIQRMKLFSTVTEHGFSLSSNVTIISNSLPRVSMFSLPTFLTTIFTLIVADRLVYPLFAEILHVRLRIGIGLVCALLAAILTMTLEIVRLELFKPNTDNTQSTVINHFFPIHDSAGTFWPTSSIQAVWVIPQCLFLGIAIALVETGAFELACIAAPQMMQTLLLWLLLQSYGVAQVLSGLLMLTQSHDPYWCFFCTPEPSFGTSTYVTIAVCSFILLVFYIFYAKLYYRLELSILKPYNQEVPEYEHRGHPAESYESFVNH